MKLLFFFEELKSLQLNKSELTRTIMEWNKWFALQDLHPEKVLFCVFPRVLVTQVDHTYH